MLIKSIGLKNIKSFGNNRQEIKFSIDNPQLILLTGRNGAGKSTIQESIDLAIYGKVRGKNKKNITLSTLPNRLNSNLEVDINFLNYNNQDIFMKKSISPNDFDIKINDVPYTSRFNLLDDIEKEKIIGFNYDMYKTFISMNVNDFLNFIHLQKVDKRNLLNKLCNLETIDSYLSIAKDISKNYNKKIDILTDKLSANLILISQYNETIYSIENSQTLTKTTRINTIKEEVATIKNEIISIKETVKVLDVEYSNIQNEIQSLKNSIKILENEYNILYQRKLRNDEKITLFDNGLCPMCETNLTDHSHTVEKANLLDTKVELDSELGIIKKKQVDLLKLGNDEVAKLKTIIENRNTNIQLYKQLQLTIQNLKNEFKELTTYNNDVTVDELKKVIRTQLLDNDIINNDIQLLQKKCKIYDDIIALLDDNGIRNNIIKSVVKPINDNIKSFLKDIMFKYSVVLDDEFNVKIYERISEEVNAETLSNGEIKIINMVIALSYIKMIRSIKNVNVLFLDEVFVSIDPEYIGLFITLLKKLSKELNLNIIIIHHGISEVDLSLFDRIITLSNKMFSNITDSDLFKNKKI